MPPKPPPISIGTTLMRDTGMLQQLRHLGAHREGALRAAPDGHVAVGVPQGRGVVRLDVALVNGGGVELALDDDGRLGEALVDVAELELEVLGDVGGLAGRLAQRLGDQVVVQQRGVVAAWRRARR